MTKHDIGIIVGIFVLFAWHLWSSREPDGTLSSDVVADTLVFGTAVIAAKFGAMRLRASGRTGTLRNVQVLLVIYFLWHLNVSWTEQALAIERGIVAMVAISVMTLEIVLRRRGRGMRPAH